MSSSEDDRSGDEREDEAEYEVQAIIGYRESDTDGDECEHYLVKWKGYDTDESTWEPVEQLDDPEVKQKIRNYNIEKRKQRLRDLNRKKEKERHNKERRREPVYSSDDEPSTSRKEKPKKDKSRKNGDFMVDEDEKVKKRKKLKKLQEKKAREAMRAKASKANAYASGSSSSLNFSSSKKHSSSSSSIKSHEKYQKRSLQKQPLGEGAAKRPKYLSWMARPKFDPFSTIIGSGSAPKLPNIRKEGQSSGSRIPPQPKMPSSSSSIRKKSSLNQNSYKDKMESFYASKDVHNDKEKKKAEENQILDDF